MNYEELDTLDTDKQEYLKIYAGYEHACSYEDYLIRKRYVEGLYA